jgi:hypothetical protein
MRPALAVPTHYSRRELLNIPEATEFSLDFSTGVIARSVKTGRMEISPGWRIGLFSEEEFVSL